MEEIKPDTEVHQAKGKGKGPKGPAPKSKGKGGKGKDESQATPAPAWQKPDLSAEWQAERVVNWQPIRQTSRLEGSVWEQVHDSLDSGAAKLPEELLGRFMRKVSEAQAQAPKASDPAVKKATKKRLLSGNQALVADIHHALLTRKGIRKASDLQWLLGTVKGEDSSDHALGEDLLEAFVGLLGAAVGEERSLTSPAALKDGAPSELFLRQLLEQVPLQELQARVELNLNLLRFPTKASLLDSGLDLALTAAWTIIDSKAMPVLLEGILLLGNSVNAGSKNLGGAVGVTLESLTKLAHTRCLPPKAPKAKAGKRRSSRDESALEVLALHLDEANEGFVNNLAADLDACHTAREFDHKIMDGLLKELDASLVPVKKRVKEKEEREVPCLSVPRLTGFLAEADPRIQQLQGKLDEIDEATASLRLWFAEPASSSLHDMLKALANLRELLPAPKPDASPCDRDYRQSATRRRRLERKAEMEANKANEPIPEPELAPEPTAPEPAAGTSVQAEDETEKKVEEPPAPECGAATGAGDAARHPLTGQVCEVAPPSGVLAQILSFCKGTIWISWLFDWAEVRRGFADATPAFEILQFNSRDGTVLSPTDMISRPASTRWRCRSPPFKTDVPLGSHYVFGVRAILLPGLDDGAEFLWASPVSLPAAVDLRYSTSAPAAGVQSTPQVHEEKSPQSSPRRGRVATGLGDFIHSLQSGGSPTRNSLRVPAPAGSVSNAEQRRVADSKETAAQPEQSPGNRGPAVMEKETAAQPEQSLGNREPAVMEKETAVQPEQSPGNRGPAVMKKETAAQPEQSPGNQEPAVMEKETAAQPEQSPASLAERSPSSPSDSKWSSEANFSDFDDDSLARLAHLFRSSLPRTGGEDSLLGQVSHRDDDGPGMDDAFRVPRAPSQAEFGEPPGEPPEPFGVGGEAEPKKFQHRLSVPRAASIFDDLDTLESMADVLSSVQSVQRGDSYDGTGSLGGLGLVEQDESGREVMLDAMQVIAEAERRCKQKCSACNGTGQVGLFGTSGFGMFSMKCSCQSGT